MLLRDEKKAWQDYAKQVKPLGKRKPPSPPQPEKQKSASAERKAAAQIKKPIAKPAPVKPASVVFDRRVERNLRQGDIAIDERLDLHGLFQDQAHDALNRFLDRNVRAGNRNLLVITGKGRDGNGVLRSSLAGWLAASVHATKILAVRPAALRHGGAGAFYVLLKKKN